MRSTFEFLFWLSLSLLILSSPAFAGTSDTKPSRIPQACPRLINIDLDEASLTPQEVQRRRKQDRELTLTAIRSYQPIDGYGLMYITRLPEQRLLPIVEALVQDGLIRLSGDLSTTPLGNISLHLN